MKKLSGIFSIKMIFIYGSGFPPFTTFPVQLFMPFFAPERISQADTPGINPYATYLFGATVKTLQSSYIFNAFGDLVIWFNNLDSITIQCLQCPYRSLQDYLMSNDLKIKNIKLTGTPTSILRAFDYLEKDVLGRRFKETIVTDNHIAPDQVQTNILEMPLGKTINGENGLLFNLGQNETIQIDFMLE